MLQSKAVLTDVFLRQRVPGGGPIFSPEFTFADWLPALQGYGIFNPVCIDQSDRVSCAPNNLDMVLVTECYTLFSYLVALY